jgi:cGMP-dependent protein kinase
MKRKNSKKQKVSSDNSHSSKESDVLKILKKCNTSLEDQILIDKCLQKNLFMRNLEKQARLEVIKQMCYCFVSKNTVIFEQGSVGSYFYIMKEGKVNLFIDNAFKKTLVPGDSFGDLALLHGVTRSGTIKALEDTYMWCLERKKFKQVVDYIANKNFEDNKTFIKTIPLFKNMDTNFITRMSMAMISVIYDPGTYIIKDGEASDCMYIIKEGSVVCSKKEKVFRTLTKGDSFGFFSILIDSPRTMNVIAKTTCECYSISVNTLIDLLGPSYKDTLYLNFIKIAINKSKYLSKINQNLLELSYSSFKPAKYDKNSLVYKNGTVMDDKVVIILEGMLIREIGSSKTDIVALTDDKKAPVAERGTILFEEQLFSLDVNKRFKIDYDINADPDCLLLEASLVDFVKHLGGSFHEITERSNLIESLSKVPLFKNFPANKIKTIAENINTETYKHLQKIIQEGEEGSKFYIVKSEKVDIFVKNQYIRTLNEFDFFGERSLFVQEPRSATAVANGPVSLYVLSKEIFTKIVDENFKQHILERASLQDNTIELSDLDYIQNLGSGNFGNVYLVNSRKKNRLYALKAVSKNQIDKENLHANLEMERKILLQIDHPFIMKLVKSLKDKEDIYFLMEFVRGKELWDVIRDIGLLNKYQTQFYGCSLFLVIDYLHIRRFVYRDIKPENVMVNDKVRINIKDYLI